MQRFWSFTISVRHYRVVNRFFRSELNQTDVRFSVGDSVASVFILNSTHCGYYIGYTPDRNRFLPSNKLLKLPQSNRLCSEMLFSIARGLFQCFVNHFFAEAIIGITLPIKFLKLVVKNCKNTCSLRVHVCYSVPTLDFS